MERYYAIVRKEADSDFGVEFPDLPGCFTAGSDLDEVAAESAEALRFHLDGLREEGLEVPQASSLAEVTAKASGADFFAVLGVDAAPAEAQRVRVNITIEERLLRRIDSVVGQRRRSAFLEAAARDALERGT